MVDSAEGSILLQLRDDRGDIVFPGHWALPGGALRSGEDPAAAIRREVAEELRPAAEARRLELRAVGDLAGPRGREHVFIAVLPEGDWSLAEGAGCAWFPLSRPPEPMPPHHRAALELVRRRVGTAALATT